MCASRVPALVLLSFYEKNESTSMKTQSWLACVAFTLGFINAGCADTAIGDPCSPARPALQGTMGEVSCAPMQGCFVGQEVYLETRSLQCRTRVCMVWHWDERTQPDQAAKRVFCTAKCTDNNQCPMDFTCTTAFVAGDPGIRGKYCVRNSLLM